MVNIKQVAERAGVSASCVSKYFRDKNSVREYNRVKIAAAVKELNYIPSHVARALRHGKTMSIKVIMPSITLPFFADIFECLHIHFNKRGYDLILQTITPDRNFTPQDFVFTDGVIVAFPDDIAVIENISGILQQMEKQMVVMAGTTPGVVSGYVSVDICDGMAKAAKFLKQSARKKIAYVGGDKSSVISSERFRGFLSEIPTEMQSGVYRSKFSMDWGYTVAQKMIETNTVPDGVLCENDGIAAGVIKCMMTNGLSVPEDVWVIGFDNIPLSEMYNPSITSVSIPSHDMSEAAADMLINTINGQEPKTISYQAELIYRESTGQGK